MQRTRAEQWPHGHSCVTNWCQMLGRGETLRHDPVTFDGSAAICAVLPRSPVVTGRVALGLAVALDEGDRGVQDELVRAAASARRIGALLAVAGMLALAGCASDGNKGGDPGAKSLPQGYTCQSVKAEIAKLDSRGVRSSVEAKSAGAKLSPQKAADADRYNQLLDYYLGARCHV